MLRLAFLLLALSTAPSFAHPGHAENSLAVGLLHPLTGIDHMLAMVSVGIWSGLLGGQRLWIWPATFVAAMVAGGAAGYAGVSAPFVEQGVMASLVVLGLMIALAVRAPMLLGGGLVAAFGLFHGHAHGTEVGDAAFAGYMLGFVASTAALHLAGIGIARVLHAKLNSVPTRLIGAGTALAGVALLVKGA